LLIHFQLSGSGPRRKSKGQIGFHDWIQDAHSSNEVVNRRPEDLDSFRAALSPRSYKIATRDQHSYMDQNRKAKTITARTMKKPSLAPAKLDSDIEARKQTIY